MLIAKYLHYLNCLYLHLTEKTEGKRQPVPFLMLWELVVELSISHIWPFLRRHLVSVLARSQLSWLVFTMLFWSIFWNNSEQHLPLNWAMEGWLDSIYIWLYSGLGIWLSCLQLCSFCLPTVCKSQYITFLPWFVLIWHITN